MAAKESTVRISLVDVLYGVVLGYGFTYFDKADSTTDYFRFFFAYFIIIIDWIYVHSLYWGQEYKYNSVLLLDIGIIFTISRILHTSTNESNSFFLWLALLFSFYVAWDIDSKLKDLHPKYDWRYSASGDFLATICFIGLWKIVIMGIFPSTLLLHTVALIIYIIAFATWFKKVPKQD